MYYDIGEDDDIESLLAAAGYEEDADVFGEDYLVGAPLGRGRVARAVASRRAAVLSERGPTKSREFPIGMDSGANVAAGAQATITSRPQVVFRPERIVVPSDIAGAFTIDDIRVGQASQLVATGAIPARTFQENATGIRLKGDTCQTAMDLVLVATNVSAAAVRFRAAVIGTVVA